MLRARSGAWAAHLGRPVVYAQGVVDLFYDVSPASIACGAGRVADPCGGRLAGYARDGSGLGRRDDSAPHERHKNGLQGGVVGRSHCLTVVSLALRCQAHSAFVTDTKQSRKNKALATRERECVSG